MSRSKAYRGGEGGIAGISDDKQRICFAIALWNGKDEILKERLFGLTPTHGNHGEDVKELYYYLDNTPTHSYMKYLYKYPQSAFPYRDLEQTNKQRNNVPGGGILEQADGTAWMEMYCLNMLEIGLELTQYNIAYEDLATKFFEHFTYIASSLNRIGEDFKGSWDEQEGFFTTF